MSFIREMNQEVYASFKGVQTIAEESTAFYWSFKAGTFWWTGIWYEMDDGMDA